MAQNLTFRITKLFINYCISIVILCINIHFSKRKPPSADGVYLSVGAPAWHAWGYQFSSQDLKKKEADLQIQHL